MLTCSLSLNGPSRGSGASTQRKQSPVTRITSTLSYQAEEGVQMVEREERVKKEEMVEREDGQEIID